MARLSRVLQKVFAKNATNNGQFGSGQAGTKIITNDPATIQALAAFENGWEDAIIGSKRFPPEEEFQSLNFLNTRQLAYIFQEGIPEWETGTTYFQKSIVKQTGTYRLYGSLVDDNVGNALSDPTKWQFLLDLSSGFGLPYGVTTNSGNDYSVTTVPSFGALTDGSPFLIKTNAANNGATRLNPNSIGLTAVTYPDGTPFVGGEFKVNGIYICVYDSVSAKIQVISDVGISGTPTGAMLPYAGATAPAGYLLCYGQAVSRATYAALFNAIGVIWGSGNGTTTFNVPDMRGRTAFGFDAMGGVPANRLTAAVTGGIDGSAVGNAGGQQAHVLTVPELPVHTPTGTAASAGAHTHTANTQVSNNGGSVTNLAYGNIGGTQTSTSINTAGAHTHTLAIDPIGGDAGHNTVPPGAVFNMIIKT